jgi:Adenylate and Guanylate cyclase catalytic domain
MVKSPRLASAIDTGGVGCCALKCPNSDYRGEGVAGPSPRLRPVFVLFCMAPEGPLWREPAKLRRSWLRITLAIAGSRERTRIAPYRLRGLRSDLIDPAIAAHHGRIVKRTGDGSLIEFRSVVDAVRCAIEVQTGMVERNGGVSPEKRIEFRIGVHLGDVVEEADGDLMGDGVNIAARLEGIAKPGAIGLSEDAYRQVKGRLDLAVDDLGPTRSLRYARRNRRAPGRRIEH